MKDLTQGSVVKHLIQMAAFLAVSMVVQTLYLLADLFWVGRLGKEAIAAVGLAGNLTIIVLALTQMLGVGTTALISQAAGQKDQPRAELAFNQSFVMSILIAAALGVVGFLLRAPYCDALSADATTAALAKSYLLWFIPGMLLAVPAGHTWVGFARDRDRETDGGVAGLECGAQHGARSVAHLSVWWVCQDSE